MGLLSSIFGGPKKQKPTQQEITQAQVAKKTDERFVSTFAPLELAEIEQFFDPSAQKFQKSVLDRKVSADTARAEQESLKGATRATQASGTNLASGSNVAGITGGLIDSASAEGLGEVEAASLAQQVRDNEGVGIIRTGRDVSRNTTNSLSALARQSSFTAGNALRARSLESGARAKALGDIISAGFVKGNQVRDDRLDAKAQRESDLGIEEISLSSLPQRGAF